MFILENVLIALGFSLLLVVAFTFLNIFTFAKDLVTAIYLTFIFFDLFVRMPFKAINSIYEERERMLRRIKKDKDFTETEKQDLTYTLQKKSRLFWLYYRAGMFSYSELMSSLNEWFINKPFKVRIRLVHMNRRKLESKYLNNLKDDLLGTS